MTRMDDNARQALDLVISGKAQKACQGDEEPDAVRESYGRDSLGEKALLARRLEDTAEWKRSGFLSPAEFLAARSKTTITAAKEKNAEVIFVTNEVGCGIVPENALAREFRDRAGVMNQRFAERADEVYWMIFGQPLRIK